MKRYWSLVTYAFGLWGVAYLITRAWYEDDESNSLPVDVAFAIAKAGLYVLPVLIIGGLLALWLNWMRGRTGTAHR